MNKDSNSKFTGDPLTRIDRIDSTFSGHESSRSQTNNIDAPQMLPMTAHVANVSLPLTRLPGMHAQMSEVCTGATSGDAFAGDIGDPGDCADCVVSMAPGDCSVYDKPYDQLDYCQKYTCGTDPGDYGGGCGGCGGNDHGDNDGCSNHCQ